MSAMAMRTFYSPLEEPYHAALRRTRHCDHDTEVLRFNAIALSSATGGHCRLPDLVRGNGDAARNSLHTALTSGVSPYRLDERVESALPPHTGAGDDMQSTDVDNPHSPELASNAVLTETEAALRLGLKVATLRAWRHQKRGPVFVQLGRAIRYLPADLQEFLRANRKPVDETNVGM